jgi:hypothetical protein
MALVTLQAIFHDAFPAYAQSHPLPAHVRNAAHRAVDDPAQLARAARWAVTPALSAKRARDPEHVTLYN